jgi:hypothetical protein
MLLRIFCKFGEYHRDEDFSYTQQPVEDEVLVHTWRDATLSELTELLAQGVAHTCCMPLQTTKHSPANMHTHTHELHTVSLKILLRNILPIHSSLYYSLT